VVLGMGREDENNLDCGLLGSGRDSYAVRPRTVLHTVTEP
jgi:hypothetical protein